jgi:hypothetical protein
VATDLILNLASPPSVARRNDPSSSRRNTALFKPSVYIPDAYTPP